MKTFILAIFICLFCNSNSNAQCLKNYGFKAGIITDYQYLNNHTSKIYFGNETGYGVCISFFSELLSYKKLSLIEELSLLEKGTSRGNVPVTGLLDTVSQLPISNRYIYLNFQSLLKFYFSKKDTGFYTLAGVRLDFMLYNYYSNKNARYIRLRNGHVEFGGTIGAGYSFPFHLFFEVQYQPNFTKMYRLIENGYDVSFTNSSFAIFCGFILK